MTAPWGPDRQDESGTRRCVAWGKRSPGLGVTVTIGSLGTPSRMAVHGRRGEKGASKAGRDLRGRVTHEPFTPGNRGWRGATV